MIGLKDQIARLSRKPMKVVYLFVAVCGPLLSAVCRKFPEMFPEISYFLLRNDF